MRKRRSQLKSHYIAEYKALINAIHRCHNENHTNYRSYGARGITVADEWRTENGFALFLDHVGPRPDANHSLDRIDNNKGYVYGNLRWTDRKTQQNNRRPRNSEIQDYGWGVGYSTPRGTGRGHSRRRSPLVPYMGRTQTVADWAYELGMNSTTIRWRLMRGLSPAEALDPNTSRAGERRKMAANELLLPTIH